MTPLQRARKAVTDAETKLDELTAQRDSYAAQLSAAQANEAALRQRRVPLPELAEAMRLSQAAAAYVSDVETEAAQLRAALPGLEAELTREELVADFGTVADAGTEARKELDAAVRAQADSVRPHLEKIAEIDRKLETAREGYTTVKERAGADAQALENEARQRGHKLGAVATPVQPPATDDPALQAAWSLFARVSTRRAAEQQAAAEASVQRARAEASERRERAARDAEPVAFAILERPEEALTRLGSLVVGSRPVPATARLPEHTEVYVTRRNVDQAISVLKTMNLRFQPLGAPRA